MAKVMGVFVAVVVVWKKQKLYLVFLRGEVSKAFKSARNQNQKVFFFFRN